MQLTVTTQPQTVQAYYQREGTILAFEIPSHINARGLCQIARQHARSPQRSCVFKLIISHPRCESTTLEELVELCGDDPKVLPSIASSAKASRALLLRLTRSEIPCVREHAELALFDRRLCEANVNHLVALYLEYRDHPSWGYGFRYRLVTDPRTPTTVLDSIASYRDPVGDQARRILERRA